MTMHPETQEKPAKYRKWLTKKADLLEEIENYEHQLEKLKAELKDTDKEKATRHHGSRQSGGKRPELLDAHTRVLRPAAVRALQAYAGMRPRPRNQ